jgi:ParB family chromosome partitioning protein
VTLQNVLLAQIIEDPTQPRKLLNEESLQGLADSIKQHGVLNPITVSPAGTNRYVIVTGERRWRAAGMARLEYMPCIVTAVDPEERLTLQLIENLQREDLQPLEKAKGLSHVKETLNLTNREVARRLGISERSVGYLLDLMELPEAIGEAVISSPNRPSEGQITEKHARFLKQLNPVPEVQTAVVEKIREEKLTGEDTGKLVKALKKRPEKAQEILKSPLDHLNEFFGDETPGVVYPDAEETAGTTRLSPTAQRILDFMPSLSGIPLNQMAVSEVSQIQDALTSLKMAVDSLLKSCKDRTGE